MQTELVTKIPKVRLMYAICDFYWDKGHRTIELSDRMEGSYYGTHKHMNYGPTKLIRDMDKYKVITVSTHKKKENKQVFDSVDMEFEETIFGTKINWSLNYELKTWQLIYGIIALGFGFVYAEAFFLGLIIAILLWIPMFLIIDYRAKKGEHNPSTETYKIEFEEFIRNTENDMFPDDS